MSHPIISNIILIFRGSLRLVKFLLTVVTAAVGFSIFSFAFVYFYFARGLPDIKTLEDYRPSLISEAFSDDGTKIGEFWTECRIFTPYEKIPKLVIEAFLDSEDARFFEHKGVDMRSIVRAFIANLKAGEITQGGSTITQQITRSLVLSRERTVTRKVKEAILATRLERYLSKEQILTLYLNQIYLGNRAYGVEAAARNYFRLPLEELSLGQIALIAGLPSAPTAFSPVNNPPEAQVRQQHVLARMIEEGHISQDEAVAAAKEEFDVYVAGVDKEFINDDAAYFTEHVRRLVKDHYGDDVLYRSGLKIYTTVNLPMQRSATLSVRKGLEALDRRQGWRGPVEHVGPDKIQTRAREIETETVEKQEGKIIIWPPGRQVLGQVQFRQTVKFETGRDYKAIVTAFEGSDTYIQIGDASGVIHIDNLKWARPFSHEWLGWEGGSYVSDPRNILKVGDVIFVRRMEDGTFALIQKPLLEGALVAMELKTGFLKAMVGGYDFGRSEFNRATQALRQPGSSFKPFIYAAGLDKGYTFNTVIVDEPVVYQVGRGKIWSPKNYGGKYNGPTPFQNALKFSRNVPTVKITFDIGTHYLTAYARKLGIETPIEKYLSMALGSNAVYLEEMVEAYAVFPNGGVYRPAIVITRIEDSKGNVIESAELPSVGPAAEFSPEDKGQVITEWRSKRNIRDDELNTGLFEKGFKAIERDSLVLTDLEIKTLYGAQIPVGHVITPQTAYLMVNLLKGVVEGGTGTRVRALEKPAGGKTGTTNDETDTWFIGFVPDLIAGVWVGFDELKQIGKGMTGGNTAAPIFVEFMKETTKDFEAKDFEKPQDFPAGNIASLAGGSSLFGSRPMQGPYGIHSGADRAGQFFEEDLEYFDSSTPPPSGPVSPGPSGGAEDETGF